jgi:hypothetical protein
MLLKFHQTVRRVFACTVLSLVHPLLTLYGLTICGPACGEGSVQIGYRCLKSRVHQMLGAPLRLDASQVRMS